MYKICRMKLVSQIKWQEPVSQVSFPVPDVTNDNPDELYLEWVADDDGHRSYLSFPRFPPTSWLLFYHHVAQDCNGIETVPSQVNRRGKSDWWHFGLRQEKS